MSLVSWVHWESTSWWVHTCEMLSIRDFFQTQLGNIIPMLHVLMLSQQSNRCLGVVRVSLWSIQIINEVNQFGFTSWSILFTSFLFQHLFHHCLQIVTICVVVEVDNLEIECFLHSWNSFSTYFLQNTFSKSCFTTSCISDQQNRMLDNQELLDEFWCRNGFTSWNSHLTHNHSLLSVEINVL